VTAATRRRGALLVLALVALAGCAPYPLAPPSPGHPAHPDAPLAPAPPLSRTLVEPPVPPAGLPAPAAPPAPARPGALAGRRVVSEGEIVATVPATGQLVVEHGRIEGFMEAMTMGYRVEPPSLLGGLAEGDRVRFTIDVERRAIVEIEKLP
jgi:Cu/Ag efflux protein CusF